jgi:beta-1,4-mannooligosaccharide/beta-1,4-mannosyl-N-acetylglucosamine phosphorylase
MKMAKIIGHELKNIPWEDRGKNSNGVIWRNSSNPIIPRDAIPCSNSIFNSSPVPFDGKFAGVFRCDTKSRQMQIHAGFSDDGIHWDIDPERIQFQGGNPEISGFEYAYDPRVCWLEDRYYVTWCNGYKGYPTIGIGYTYDFKEFFQMENAYLPFNRNGVLFPRKINGKYIMLNRPSDNGHTPFGDIFISQSPDMTYWGEHRLAMSVYKGAASSWQSLKIGAGPIPIETSEGWLMIYHGVLCSCNGFVYSFGAALLDLDEPWKVIARGKNYLLSPQESYECVGDVPNVAFPCAALVDAPTDRIAIYYGCADTTTGLCFGYINEIIEEIKTNSI